MIKIGKNKDGFKEITKFESWRAIRNSKKYLKKMFKALRYFDETLRLHPDKEYYYSHFIYLFPKHAQIRPFMDNICASLQFIREYMENNRSNWANIVEVKQGNIVFEGNAAKFYIETKDASFHFEHDVFLIIDDITSIINPMVSIKYGNKVFHDLVDCPINIWEHFALGRIGCMISDALTSIYLEYRAREEERKK